MEKNGYPKFCFSKTLRIRCAASPTPAEQLYKCNRSCQKCNGYKSLGNLYKHEQSCMAICMAHVQEKIGKLVKTLTLAKELEFS